MIHLNPLLCVLFKTFFIHLGPKREGFHCLIHISFRRTRSCKAVCCGNVSRHTLLNETELWSWLSLFIVHRLETYRIVEHQHNNNLKILKKTLRGWEAVLCWGPAINDIRVSHIPTLALQKAKSVCLNWVWKYHHYEYISEIEDVVSADGY